MKRTRTFRNDALFYLDGYLPAGDCAFLVRELEKGKWQRSRVTRYTKRKTGTSDLSDARTSRTQHYEDFTGKAREYVAGMERRLSALLDTDPRFFEDWQATRYAREEKFDFHLDSYGFGKSRSGLRRRSVLIYLDTPASGGETCFRALDLKIKARAGRLVVWNNLLPSGRPDYAMVHAGLPLHSGQKHVIVTWERQRKYRP